MSKPRLAIGRVLDRAFFNIFRRYPFLILLGLIALIGEFGYGIILVTLPLFLVDTFGTSIHVPWGHLATIKLITYSVAAFAVSETLSQTLTGSLGDRIGRRPLILFGATLSAVASSLMFALRVPLLYVPARFLDGMGAASIWPAVSALAGDLTEERDRATAMSVISTSRMVGLAFGPPAGLLLSSATGSNRTPFLASVTLFSTVLLIALLVLPVVLRRQHLHVDRRDRRERHRVAHGLHDAWRLLRSCPTLIVMLLTYVVLQFGVTLPAPLIPVYAKHFLKFTEREMSVAFLVPVLTVGLISIPLARVADKFGKLLCIRWSLAICAAGMFAVPFFRHLVPIMLMIGFLATAYAWGIPAWLGETSILAGEGKQGLALGMMNAARGVGFCLGPIVGGEAWSRFGPTAPYFCSAALFALCFVAVLCLGIWPRTKEIGRRRRRIGHCDPYKLL